MKHLSAVHREAKSSRARGGMTILTVMTAKPGTSGKILELQFVQHRRLMEIGCGIRGVRIYRALDDTSIVSLISFDTIDSHARWLESGNGLENVDVTAALIERIERGCYQLEYGVGDIGSASMKPKAGSVIWLNNVTTKPGRLGEFLDMQIAGQNVLRGNVAGVRGNRIYRCLDDRKVLMLASFDSPNDHKRWIQSDRFMKHVHELLPLIERGDRGYYDAVYEHGDI